jgi:hypothetical protein
LPNITLRLEIEPGTGRRTVVISYESDSDALPMEHEEEHRALVGKLMEGGLVKAGDRIRVERETSAAEADSTREQEESARRSIEEKS